MPTTLVTFSGTALVAVKALPTVFTARPENSLAASASVTAPPASSTRLRPLMTSAAPAAWLIVLPLDSCRELPTCSSAPPAARFKVDSISTLPEVP